MKHYKIKSRSKTSNPETMCELKCQGSEESVTSPLECNQSKVTMTFMTIMTANLKISTDQHYLTLQDERSEDSVAEPGSQSTQIERQMKFNCKSQGNKLNHKPQGYKKDSIIAPNEPKRDHDKLDNAC